MKLMFPLTRIILKERIMTVAIFDICGSYAYDWTLTKIEDLYYILLGLVDILLVLTLGDRGKEEGKVHTVIELTSYNLSIFSVIWLGFWNFHTRCSLTGSVSKDTCDYIRIPEIALGTILEQHSPLYTSSQSQNFRTLMKGLAFLAG